MNDVRCPFCGESGYIGVKVMPDCGGETYKIATCDNCGAEGPAQYLERTSSPPIEAPRDPVEAILAVECPIHEHANERLRLQQKWERRLAAEGLGVLGIKGHWTFLGDGERQESGGAPDPQRRNDNDDPGF